MGIVTRGLELKPIERTGWVDEKPWTLSNSVAKTRAKVVPAAWTTGLAGAR